MCIRDSCHTIAAHFRTDPIHTRELRAYAVDEVKRTNGQVKMCIRDRLMGIVRVTPHGIVTDSGERIFFLIQPDNLSVLSPEVIRGRVRSLTMLLSTQPSLEILALDSRESFQRNKERCV